jgi:hypothetical protein
LRWQNGAAAFFVVVAAFLILHVVIPSLKQLWHLPGKPKSELPPPPEESGAPRAVALLIGLLLLGGAINGRSWQDSTGCSAIRIRASTVGNPEPFTARARPNPSRNKSASRTSLRWRRRKSAGRRKKARYLAAAVRAGGDDQSHLSEAH